MKKQRGKLAEDLEAVLSGITDLNAVLDDAPSFGEPMRHCFHGLQHFLADADIRAKDPEYKSMQYSEMRKLIHLLKSDAGPAQLEAVHFLGQSK